MFHHSLTFVLAFFLVVVDNGLYDIGCCFCVAFSVRRWPLKQSKWGNQHNSNLKAPSAKSSFSFVLQSSKSGDETRGAALLLENVNVYRGPSRILKNLNWRVEPCSKWALVGANGVGKSTLLKAIVGHIPFEGDIAFGRVGAKSGRLVVGYLQQTAVAGSNKTVFEEAASGMEAINRARLAMEEAAEAGDLDALERATTLFEAVGGYQQEKKVSSVLKGLGFVDFDQRCDELSGGWQMRTSFAKVLLSEPDICFLDEPGNHLDNAAKKWLARYLAEYDGDGAMVLVTHDVELLKSMDHIAEIVSVGDGGGSLQIYKSCNYEQYLQLKQERAEAAVAAFEKNAEKAAKLQSFVDRFGASATKASAAQSRVKQIERMEREGLLDAPAEALVAKQFKPTLVLPAPPKAVGEILLSLKNVAVGYDAETPLVTGVDFSIHRGMKLLVRGPNGAGKSTILHALRGSLPLLSGERIENGSLRLGIFTQDLAQELDPEKRAVDIVTAHAREGRHGDITISEQTARSALGRLGLVGEKAMRCLKDLSGGEKARVALAMFSLKPSNLYLLDECSNHLDIACVEALSDALREWGTGNDNRAGGAMVVISHDRAFCEKIEFTHVATVRDGKFTLEERAVRDSDWYIDSMLSSTTKQSRVSSSTTKGEDDCRVDGDNRSGQPVGDTRNKDQLDPKLRKQAFNAPKRIAKLEQLIASAEKESASIEAEMMSVGNDVSKLMELTQKKNKIAAAVDKYMAEWEELEQLLSLVAA